MRNIEFHYELPFKLEDEDRYVDWILNVIKSEDYKAGEINYIFCDDNYLLKLHKEHLQKDTYTDIITFDNTSGKLIHGDIFISVDRVKENAIEFSVEFLNELQRVMAHGLLHMLGYKDKEEEDINLMRKKENEKIELFHVEP